MDKTMDEFYDIPCVPAFNPDLIVIERDKAEKIVQHLTDEIAGLQAYIEKVMCDGKCHADLAKARKEITRLKAENQRLRGEALRLSDKVARLRDVVDKVKEMDEADEILVHKEKCSRCDGTGVVPETIYDDDWNPIHGANVCPACKGTGKESADD